MTRYAPYGIVIRADADLSDNIYGGITSQSIDTGAEVNSEVTAGAPNPQFGEIAQSQAGGNFVTHDISAMLQKIGLTGLCMSGGTTPGFAIYTLAKDACGSIASGSVHRRLKIPNALVVPQSLSVRQGQRASLTCQVMSFYDGTNNPIQVETSIAAPSGMTDLIGFHLGPVIVGSFAIGQVTSVDINFGNQIVPEYDDGEIWPTSLHIERQQPVITINTHDVVEFGTNIPLTGLLGTHANTSIVLRKRSIGTGAFVSGANHIKLTAGGVCLVRETQASGNSPHSMTIQITTLDDGTNAMIEPVYNHTL